MLDLDYLMRAYGGPPSLWLKESRQVVDHLLLLRDYRVAMKNG